MAGEEIPSRPPEYALPAAGCAAIVAGSGIALTDLLDEVLEERPFPRLACTNQGRIHGHAYRFVLGRHRGRDVILQCGRRHLYEGCTLREATATVDTLRELGAACVILTNAAGALDPALRPGDLVAATTVRCWPAPRYGLPPELLPDFVPPGADRTGPYRWMHGPCYETRAEVAALRALGDVSVGMSVAPEMLRCKELGLPAGVVSCVTNTCGGTETLTHAAVLEVAGRASARLRTLLARALTA